MPRAAAVRPQKLYVFHPSPNLVSTVDALLADVAPGLAFENVIEPGLLDRAIRTGVTDEVRAEVANVLADIPADPTPLVLCTCSTLGGIAEDIGRSMGRAVIRIDRPMAERAVELGPIIGVAAALESTLGPTQELLRQVAAERGLAVDLRVIHCAEAWEHKKRGDEAAYISAVVDCLEASADGCDVIVLAQGSMAAAADRVSLEPPILSSPRLGVKRVADMMGANN